MEARRLRVQELRDELGRRGLDTRGLKAELAERLQAALDSEGARRGDAAGAEGRYGLDNHSHEPQGGYQGHQDPQGGYQDHQGHQGHESQGYQGHQGHESQGYQGHEPQGYQGHQGHQGHDSQGYQSHESQGYQGHQSHESQGYQGHQSHESQGYQPYEGHQPQAEPGYERRALDQEPPGLPPELNSKPDELPPAPAPNYAVPPPPAFPTPPYALPPPPPAFPTPPPPPGGYGAPPPPPSGFPPAPNYSAPPPNYSAPPPPNYSAPPPPNYSAPPPPNYSAPPPPNYSAPPNYPAPPPTFPTPPPYAAPPPGFGGGPEPPPPPPSRKRPLEEPRGRGYYGHREEKRARSPQPPAEEEEEDFDDSLVAVDTYNCDLHFKVARDRYSGYPLTIEGFAYLWSGARATYGARQGRVCFEMKVMEEISVQHLPSSEPDPHVVRVGWSLDSCSTQLGEEPFSYGYGGTGRKSTESRFQSYGDTFGEGDVIACLADFEAGDEVELSFLKNGRWQGVAFRVSRVALAGRALFPHVLVKNCAVEFNFGQRAEPFWPLPPGFVLIQHLPLGQRLRGTLGPRSKADCEILMMVGLPAAGKTTWAVKHAAANPGKKYNILGTNAIMDKMRVMGLRRQRNYAGRWDVLIHQATQCLNRLIQIAARKRRNYILDQTNVYGSAQRRKMRPFQGFQRKAIVVCPTDRELRERTVKRTDEEGKDVPDHAVLEMKANFTLPEEGEFLDSVQFVELPRAEAQALVLQYNREGRGAAPAPARASGTFQARPGASRTFQGPRGFRGAGNGAGFPRGGFPPPRWGGAPPPPRDAPPPPSGRGRPPAPPPALPLPPPPPQPSGGFGTPGGSPPSAGPAPTAAFAQGAQSYGQSFAPPPPGYLPPPPPQPLPPPGGPGFGYGQFPPGWQQFYPQSPPWPPYFSSYDSGGGSGASQ